ncbi:TIGR03936 family radical SAM-associated protein [Clostridiaceae bacterium 35-E11]
MYRIRMRFTKTDRMRFISHLDLMRLMERTLRRADVPLVFSQGFNPHPKIAFATALSLGIASEGEYMDIEIEKEIDLQDFKDEMNRALPKGITILCCKYIAKTAKALMATVAFSSYIIKCPLEEKLSIESLQNAVKDFMNLREIIHHKITKKRREAKTKEENIKSFIKSIEVVEGDELEFILKVILATGSNGNLKPELLIEKFKEITKMPILIDNVRIHRLDLYGIRDDQLASLLEFTA